MSRKIMGVTVGTPTSPSKIAREITPAEIGAAPAGFGLGAVATEITDWNTATKNGWYVGGEGIAQNAPDDNHTWFGVAYNWTQESIVIQKIWGVLQPDKYCSCERMIYPSHGTPWEWVNPPMQLGVEYRTTERYLGKPVYVKAVDLGILPNNSEKVVQYNGTATFVVELHGIATTENAFFNLTKLNEVIDFHATRNDVFVTTNYDMGYWTGHAFIKYTKD